MGRAKLLLELEGRTVISRLVETLQCGGCDGVWLLARRDDVALQAAVCDLPVRLLLTDTATADMRASVERLLKELARVEQPRAELDGWLLCPADYPVLRPELVRRLLARWREFPQSIVVPRCGERRGHPTIFPWSLETKVMEIPDGQGLNWLLKQPDVSLDQLIIEDPAILQDLDTPAEFERLRDQLEETAGPELI